MTFIKDWMYDVCLAGDKTARQIPLDIRAEGLYVHRIRNQRITQATS